MTNNPVFQDILGYSLSKEVDAMQKRKKKGQSTLEYIILVAGVIAVIIVFLGPGGIFERRFNATLGSATDGMQNMANRLLGSR